MQFGGILRGMRCCKCGEENPSITTVVRRAPGYSYGDVTICEVCLFKAVLGDAAYERAVAATSLPHTDKSVGT